MNLYIKALLVAEFCRVKQWLAMVIAFAGIQMAPRVYGMVADFCAHAFFTTQYCAVRGYTLTHDYRTACNDNSEVFQFNPLNWNIGDGLLYGHFAFMDAKWLPFLPAAIGAAVLVKVLGEYAKRRIDLTA